MGLANNQHAPAVTTQPVAVHPIETQQPEVMPARASITAAPKIPDEQQVGQLVEEWRSAWQSRDIGGYLKAYGTGFSPSDGNSRDAWITARQNKLATGEQDWRLLRV